MMKIPTKHKFPRTKTHKSGLLIASNIIRSYVVRGDYFKYNSWIFLINFKLDLLCANQGLKF